MSTLTWNQQQRKALGLPYEGKCPPALMITLADGGDPDLGYELRVLELGWVDRAFTPQDIVEAYHERILDIVAIENLFAELPEPQVEIRCVPELDKNGNFPHGHTIYAEVYDYALEGEDDVAVPHKRPSLSLVPTT